MDYRRQTEEDSPVDDGFSDEDTTETLPAAQIHAKPKERPITFSNLRALGTDPVPYWKVTITQECLKIASFLEKHKDESSPDVYVRNMPAGHSIGTAKQWELWSLAFQNIDPDNVLTLFSIIENEDRLDHSLRPIFMESRPPQIRIPAPTIEELRFTRMVVMKARDAAISEAEKLGRPAPPQAVRALPQTPAQKPPPLATKCSVGASVTQTSPNEPAVRFEPQRRAPTATPGMVEERQLLGYVSHAQKGPGTEQRSTFRSLGHVIKQAFHSPASSQAGTPSSSQTESGSASPMPFDIASAFGPYVHPTVQPFVVQDTRPITVPRSVAARLSSSEEWERELTPCFLSNACSTFELESPGPIPLTFRCPSNHPTPSGGGSVCSSRLSMTMTLSDLVFAPDEAIHMANAGPSEMANLVGDKLKRSFRLT